MSPNDRAEILEECLREIQSGKSLQQVLDAHSLASDPLRPVLEAAILARSLDGHRAIPASAQSRSRAQFLAAAGGARPVRRQPWFHLRFSTSALVVIVVLLVVAVIGSGIASAQSLPGDALYPVKITIERARLSFAQDPANRLTLEESFDEERAEETGQLIRMGRNQSMNFAGFLQREPGEDWEAAGLHLWLTPEQAVQATAYQGMYVEIQGTATALGVTVESIQARLFNLSGTVQQVQNGLWIIGGVNVHVTPQTKVAVPAKAGQNVFVTAMRQENSDLVALIISPMPVTATYLPPTQETEDNQPAGTSIPALTGTQSWQEAMPTITLPSGGGSEEKMVTPEESEQQVAPQDKGGGSENQPSSGSNDGHGDGEHSSGSSPSSSGSGEDH